jgi:hypothetical protein
MVLGIVWEGMYGYIVGFPEIARSSWTKKNGKMEESLAVYYSRAFV